jgi:hypothetical protein
MRRLVWTCVAALVLACLAGTLVTTADEGMWPLYSLEDLDFNALKARGLELSPNEIYNETDGGLSAAVVQVGGGTGSFVSPNGLILTNHHVAFGALQRQSSVDEHVLHDGFLASTLADEIPAIGYNAYITKSFVNVTKKMKSVLKDDMTDLERYEALEAREKELIEEAEKAGDVRCRIAATHGGTYYYLVTMFRIQDIRIVYAPPQAIGEFGGDIDNWMWPRHTGDFSFLRAYVAPDGSGAEYAEDNVPFKSNTYLAISSGPLHEGDFAMIVGYPGQTMRYRSSFSINEHVNHNYPEGIQDVNEILAIMDAASAADPDAAIKLAGTIKGLNNYLKNMHGQQDGLKKANLLEKKRAEETELASFIAADPKRTAEYGDVMPRLKALYATLDEHREQERAFDMMPWVCRYYSLASRLYKWSIEKQKPDLERDFGYMERDKDNMIRGLREAQHTLEPATDAQLMEYFTMRMLRLPEGQRIEGIDKYFPIEPGADTGAIVHDWVTGLYAGTNVGDADQRAAMFDMSQDELIAMDDPFIHLARDLYDLQEEIETRWKKFSGAVDELGPKFIEAIATMRGKSFYPDANGTIRLSYGEVTGYSPADAVQYKYVTTLTGVIEKETGEVPFASPQALLDVYASGDLGGYADPELGDVPVNVLTTNDGTGGNSGSPIMNGKGDLIGIDFDTNWEGIVGDYVFDPVVKRSIIVDSRYVLFVLDRVYHAQNVMDELTVH